jgi:hypothetical protein
MQSPIEKFRDKYKKNRELVCEALRSRGKVSILLASIPLA